MITRMTSLFRRFRGREEGHVTTEFAIMVPLLLVTMLSAVELGVMTLRYSMLERALDLTVRDLRLGTGAAQQHDDIRDTICARSGFIDNCNTSLRLEMVQVDPFNWVAIDETPDCVNTVEEVQPVRSFTSGQSNELMFIRACMKFNPIFPQWGLGDSLSKDADGRISLFAASAFVQEPR